MRTFMITLLAAAVLAGVPARASAQCTTDDDANAARKTLKESATIPATRRRSSRPSCTT